MAITVGDAEKEQGRELLAHELKERTVVVLQKEGRPKITIWVRLICSDYVVFHAGETRVVFVAKRNPDGTMEDDTPAKDQSVRISWRNLMPFPATRAAMVEAGYSYATLKTCKCGASMELWNTPTKNTMPMNPMPDADSPAVSHWATCTEAAQFRRKKPQ